MLALGRVQPEAFVFSTRTGTAIMQRNAAREITKAAKSIGLDRVGFHALRHGFASTLILAGLDPVRVQRQLGHARPSITLDVYAHLFERAAHADDLRERIAASALAGAVAGSR
jgi:integrase